MAYVRYSLDEGDNEMILVPFDDWKDDCGLEATGCDECDGGGYIECCHCGHDGDCSHCSDGLINPDYSGEYLRHLKVTMIKLTSCMAVTVSQKKSVIKSIRSDSRIASRYREMRWEGKRNAG